MRGWRGCGGCGRKEGKNMELTEKDIRRIAKETVKRELREIKRKEHEQKLEDTKNIMEDYKNALFHLRNINAEEETREKADSKYLDRLEQANTSTRIMIRNVDRALAEISRRRAEEGRQQEYRAFQLRYIEGLAYEKVVDQMEKESGQQIGKVTPRRWCDGIIEELSTLLWGI